MSKLKRATVPICRKCQSAMIDISHQDGWWNYNCPECDEVCLHPYWGYYISKCPGKNSCENCEDYEDLKRRIYDALEYVKKEETDCE